MKPTWRLFIALGIPAAVLAGCGPVRARCQPIFAFQPAQLDPSNDSVVDSLQPVLSWSYPESCKPRDYEVDFWTNSSLEVASDTGLGGVTGNPTPAWSPPTDLEVGQAYMWRVAARNDTVTGPFSDFWLFVVGPTCETADLAAPEIITPAAGTVVHTIDPEYRWGFAASTCTPEGYRLQVSTQPDFSTLVYDDRRASAYRAAREGKGGIVLSDCTTYYWRVAATHGTDDGPWSSVADFRVLASANCPCTAEDLVQPFPLQPGPYAIVPTLLPTLHWSFNGECVVEGFAVHLSPIFDMSDPSLFGGTGSPATTWAPGSSLQPASQYWWQVAAGVGTDVGPYSSVRSFFTGPECTTELGAPAPELISPANGEHIADGYAVLRYKPGLPPSTMEQAVGGMLDGCIPDGYFINLQTSAAFDGTNLLTEYSLPSTTVLTDPLADCTHYYWKVAAVQGGVRGPESDTGWFVTDENGTCPQVSFSAQVLSNLNCRLGASMVFPVKRVFLQGDMVEVLGRSRDKLYLVLKVPEGGQCWAPTSFLTPFFNLDDLEIRALPPTPIPPTPTPVCTRDLPQDRCEAAGGTWTRDTSILTAVVYYCQCPR